MKYFLFVFLVAFNNTTAIAQAPAIQWQKSLGGILIDHATCIKQTSEGGYIICGYSISTDGDVTGNHGNIDYWIVKLTSSGIITWQKSIGGSSIDQAYAIQQTLDGGYIVAGVSNSNDGDVTGNHGGNDYWIVKLSSSGSILWQKSLGGTGFDWAYSIQQTSDSGYIVSGESSSNNGDVSGNHGGADDWIVKLSSAGNIQWQKSFGGTGSDGAYSIHQTSEGGYIVAGYSYSNDSDVTGNHGGQDCWVVKLSSIGNIQWQKSLGGTLNEATNSIQQSSDGGYIIAGLTASNNGDVSGNHGTGGNEDFWIVKLSSMGSIQWQKCYGGTSTDAANCIQQTSDGGYIVAGISSSTDGDITMSHGPGGDYWIIKISATGSLQWQKSYGSWADDWAYSIQQTSDGGYIIAGISGSNDGDVTGHHGNQDFWIVKLGVNNVVNTINNPLITILPNPTTGTISITGTTNASIQVYNTIGQLITSAKKTDHISIAEFPTGLYFVRVFNEQGELLKQEKVVKQ